jgi:hypothetical protein
LFIGSPFGLGLNRGSQAGTASKIIIQFDIFEEKKKNQRAPPRAAPEYSEPPETSPTMMAGPDMMNRFLIY